MAAQANDKNLIWIDLEMTGLNTLQDEIIEIATIVTDANLNILAEGPVLAIYQPSHILAGMDSWNTKTHTNSGLLDRIKMSKVTVAEAEAKTLEFLQTYVPAGKSPMAGNSICQDRRFLHRLMPKLETYFHYRNLDVSTVKELALRWAPQVYKSVKKESKHMALGDIKDAINELRHYREHFFRLPN